MTLNEPSTGRSTETPSELSARLNLPFGDDLRLLTRALTHRSYINEHQDVIADNERLEFLGDAVLDFVVGSLVYNRYPEMAEGEMTRMRSALVRTESLAEFARQLDLGRAIRMGRGELQGGGRDREVLLCATFEALVGAIYQFKGLEAARDFVMPLLLPMTDIILSQMHTLDPKSRLQELTQSRGWGIPEYVTAQAEGPEHAKIFEVEVHIKSRCLGKGSGASKQVGQQIAAQRAIETIEMLDPDWVE
jgi:ribonuclease-3